VIGLRHPKWDERPLLVVVPQNGETATREELLAFLEGKVASWWIPEDVVFVDEIPHTATGKIQKTALRERFKDYVFPTVAAQQGLARSDSRFRAQLASVQAV
jgi:fatty-acyl-CoA synthase